MIGWTAPAPAPAPLRFLTLTSPSLVLSVACVATVMSLPFLRFAVGMRPRPAPAAPERARLFRCCCGMTQPPRFLAVATALPPFRLRQEEVREVARTLYGGRMRDFDRLAPVFANSGIETRYAVRPVQWYLEPHGWPERTAAYEEGALALLEQATRHALELSGLRLADVDAMVCVSTTGIATPSLDALLIERMGFRSDTMRLPIFGLGCAGGVLGLARAAALARATPGATVLLLVVELCTLSHRVGDATPADVVASALFADGAAAVLLRVDSDGGPRFIASAEHTWPGTRSVMGWRVEDDGFGVIFRQDIPDLVRSRLGVLAANFLERHGLRLDGLEGAVCHPGGAKVLRALEAAFSPVRGGFAESWAVLRECGNMSAASVLFVLERRLRSGAGGAHLMSALGPGFTAGLALVEL